VNQRQHLQTVFQFKPSGFDPYVEKHRETSDGLSYGSWNKYAQQDQIDERSVLPNEIVIDIDAETTEECRAENKQVCRMLDNQGLPYFVADTGGTGFHIHIFFQIPDNKENIGSYREALYNWLKQEAEEKTQVDTELWDDGVVEFDSELNNGHLVRAVGGRKTSTGHRKTVVLSSTLDKEQVEEPEQVEYPPLNPREDFWKISKLDSSDADLSWTEVNQAAEKIQEEKEERRTQKLESNYEAEDDGIQALREIPTHEVLKQFFDIQAQPGDMVRCVVHDSEDPDAKITDGSETNVPGGRYGCFGDSCTEKGETIHWYNSIDLLTEGKDLSFKQAKQKLAEQFDVELEKSSSNEVTGDPSRFFKDSENLRGFKPNKVAKEIERDYEFVFNKMQEQLYYYDGGVYRNDGARLVKEECNRRLEDEFKMSRVNDTLNAIKTRPGVAKSKKEFRPPEYKINFQNGVYDLMKEELVPHSKDYYFTSQIPHDYNPEAEGSNVREFFEEVTEKEEEAKTLMELSGFAMLPSMPISAAFLLVGKGDNGKTVFLNTLRELIGEEHAKDEDLQQLEHTRFGTSSLYRKLLVVSDDMPSTELETGGTLKGITGGGQVRAEFKGGDHFEFKNYATPVFACNEVPETEDQSDGFFRRWTLIDFPYKFTENPEENHEKQKKSKFQLEKELYDEEEQEAYAYQAVQSLLDVLENQGFTAQKPAEETRKKWNGYANPVMEFIYKYVEQGLTANEAERQASSNQKNITQYDFDFIPKDELFELVSAYAEARNARPPENKTELKRKLDKADFYFSNTRTTQTDYEEGRTRVYRGIKYSDEFHELLEESESFQGFLGKLEILSVSGRTHAHSSLKMRIEDNTGNPGRIEYEDEESVFEKYDPSPQKQIVQAFDELDAVGSSGVTRTADEIEEKTDLDAEDFQKLWDRMQKEGLIHEYGGEFKLDSKCSPDQVVA